MTQLRADGTIASWGNNGSGQSDAPAGQYTGITAGGSHTCGLRTNGTIDLLGHGTIALAQTDVPAGQYTAVIDSGGKHACGLARRRHHRPAGDRTTAAGRLTRPSGQYRRHQPPANMNSCALRTDGTIKCWGVEPDESGDCVDSGQADAPEGQYSAISAVGSRTCGLRADGTATCWSAELPKDSFMAAIAPRGQFSAISASFGDSCGLGTDGTIHLLGFQLAGAQYRDARRPVHRRRRRRLPIRAR